MMYCRNCGKQLVDDANFCDQCGTQTDSANAETTGGFGYQTNQTRQDFQQSWKNNNWISSMDSNVICALAYIPFLFWLPLAFYKGNQFGKQTANQGLILLICQIALQFLWQFLKLAFRFVSAFLIPFSFLSGLIELVIGVFQILLFVSMIIGIVRGLKGEFYEIPVIGKFKLIQ